MCMMLIADLFPLRRRREHFRLDFGFLPSSCEELELLTQTFFERSSVFYFGGSCSRIPTDAGGCLSIPSIPHGSPPQAPCLCCSLEDSFPSLHKTGSFMTLRSHPNVNCSERPFSDSLKASSLFHPNHNTLFFS